jgi:putative hemolysin
LGSLTLLHILSLLLLLLLSAFFSGSEAALFSLSPHRLRRLVSENPKFSGILTVLLSTPTKTLVVILLGNALVNVGASFFAALISFRMVVVLGLDQTLGMAIGVSVMTFLLLVFGEITPKWYGLQRAERVSLENAPLLKFFSVLFWPISSALEFLVGRALRGLPHRSLVTLEEIKTMLEIGRETKSFRRFEEEIIRNVFDFGRTTVQEIMTSRSELFALYKDVLVEEARDLAKKRLHSRIPVYDESLDDIVGVLHIKDMLTPRLSRSSTVLNLAKPAYFVPETMPIEAVLEEFQRKRIHFAVVVDEHGGTAGAVTLDDVLGEIVGDITEERREGETPEIIFVGDGEFLVDGYASLGDLKEKCGLDVPVADFTTLSGLIYGLSGKVPAEGQEIVHKGATYRVEVMAGRRIARVRIRKQT